MHTDQPKPIPPAIVLVGTQSPGNIGMVCRAMKNMGLDDLRLVAPQCDPLADEALMFAVSAKNLLREAKRFETLDDALADCTSAVATTRRSGKYRQELMTPEQAVEQLLALPTQTALVFGREDHGLSTDELKHCPIHATIPSDPACGSLNLAQAVLIFSHTYRKACLHAMTGPPDSQPRVPALLAEHEPFFSHLEQTLTTIGYLNPQNPDHLMKSMRRIFFRAGLDQRELSLLRGVLSQVDWAVSGFHDRKKSS